MVDERYIQFLLRQLNQEKAEKQALIEEFKAMREEILLLHTQNCEHASKLDSLIADLKSKIERLTVIISEKDAEIAQLYKDAESIAKDNEKLILELNLTPLGGSDSMV